MTSREHIHSFLRDYQSAAVDAVFAYWRAGKKNPIVEVPTGGGKSRILAAVAADTVRRGGRVLIATHRSELVVQDAEACRMIAGAHNVGVYSDKLGKKETWQPIIVASVQSIAGHEKLLGRRDLLEVDEAHLVGPEPDSQYRSMVAVLSDGRPGFQVLGLTATPYRAGQGMITQGPERLFDAICYRITVKELLNQGHLSPLTAPAVATIHTDKADTARGDWVAADLMLADNMDEVTQQAAKDVAAALEAGRKSALLFGVTVDHARQLAEALNVYGIVCDVVTGNTPTLERARILESFKSGQLRAIASMGVLTTGFDAPRTDVLAVVRPTKSTSLYVQMAGRGMRPCEGKTDCLYLDYGGNIAEHGPVTAVTIKEKRTTRKKEGEVIKKTCPQCAFEQPAGNRTCESCGFDWPPPKQNERRANKQASGLDPMAEKAPEKAGPRIRHDGVTAAARLYRKSEEGLLWLRVDYRGRNVKASQWLGFGGHHEPWARAAGAKWWGQVMDLAPPATEAEALAIIEQRGIAIDWIETQRIGGHDKVKKVGFSNAV